MSKSAPWLRSYRDALHNPKIIRLSDRHFRIWQCCLWIADDAGVLPQIADLACHLRMSVVEAEQVVCDLIDASLIDVSCPGTGIRQLTMHDWSTHQYVEKSTDRVRKFRNKNKDKDTKQNETFQKRRETPPEPDPETDTDTESKLQLSNLDAARARPSGTKPELGINSICKSGSGSRDGMETLLRNAEGFGLDVDDLVETTNRNRPKKREGYFITLCVNRLKDRLPGLDEQLLRDALNGKHEPYKTVCALLVGAPA